MKRKVFAVVLTLALLVGGVAIGIHVLHKKALAQVDYQVDYIVEVFDEWEQEMLEGATIKMNLRRLANGRCTWRWIVLYSKSRPCTIIEN